MTSHEWLGEELAPVAFRDKHGSVTVSHLPKRLLVTDELLRWTRGHVLTRYRRTLRIRCTNASADYRLVRFWNEYGRRVLGAERMS